MLLKDIHVIALLLLLLFPLPSSTSHHILVMSTDQEAHPLLLQLSSLLSSDYRVTTLLYGGATSPAIPASGGGTFKLIHVPTTTTDPVRNMSWLARWEHHLLQVPDDVVASRVAGCVALSASGALISLKPHLLISTLYLDDACLLRLVPHVAVLGVLSSPVGVPWVTLQLGGHFPVSLLPVHGYRLGVPADFYSRLGNAWRWWQLQRRVRWQYQTPVAVTMAAEAWAATAAEAGDIGEQYRRLAAVYVSGDRRLQTDVPSDHRVKFLGCIECASFHDLPQEELSAIGSSGVLVLRLQHPYVSLPSRFSSALVAGAAASGLTTIDVSNVTNDVTNVTDTVTGSGTGKVMRSDAPAADVLAHPRARVFVSECSAASVLLAVHFSVPLVCVPFTAGHRHVAARVAAVGLGVEMDRRSLTADSLRAAIAVVTSSGALRRTVRTRADALRHDIVSPAAQFAHDVRHVLLFGAQRRQRRPGGFVEYYCLDVVVTCAASGAVFAGLILTMFWCAFRAIMTRTKAKKE